MAFSKAHRFAQADFHLSLVCVALGHPARIRIIRTLHEKEKCTVRELKSGMPISASSVSQHLAILRAMHLLCCEQVYPTVFYWLNPDMPKTQRALIDLVHRVNIYFPTVDKSEIASVGRSNGPKRPA